VEAARVSLNALAHAMRQRLPAMEKWLLVLLGDRADPWGGSIYFALDTIVDSAGMSLSTVKRTFRTLIPEHLTLEVPATPTTPAFYRIRGVPEPLDAKRSDDGCPNVLRKAVLYYFPPVCSWCGFHGTKQSDSDGKAWAVTLIDPVRYVGKFTPDNVTRSCASCARKKTRERSTTVRALTEVVAVKGVQLDPPRKIAEGIHPDPREGSTGTPGGFNLNPDPDLDPDRDPVQTKQGLRPSPRLRAAENADDNLGVITVIAHEAIDQLGPDHEDLVETIKSLCANRDISYDSAVVHKALKSASWQRTRVRA
jgi:hypothetical protein